MKEGKKGRDAGGVVLRNRQHRQAFIDFNKLKIVCFVRIKNKRVFTPDSPI